MRKILAVGLSSLIAVCTSVSAHAATITKQYVVTSQFRQNSAPPVIQTLVLTFDPGVAAFDLALDSYSTDSPLLAFNNGPIRFSVSGPGGSIYFSGLDSSGGYSYAEDDFLASFAIDEFGNPEARYPDFDFGPTFGGQSYHSIELGPFFGAVTSVVASDVSPVPEPAAWIMLIAGFGAVGTAMRRRQNFRVSFA